MWQCYREVPFVVHPALGNNYIFCWTVLFLLWHTKCQCHSYMLQWCFGEVLCTKLANARQQIALFISLLFYFIFLNLSQSLDDALKVVWNGLCVTLEQSAQPYLKLYQESCLPRTSFIFFFFSHTLLFSAQHVHHHLWYMFRALDFWTLSLFSGLPCVKHTKNNLTSFWIALNLHVKVRFVEFNWR